MSISNSSLKKLISRHLSAVVLLLVIVWRILLYGLAFLTARFLPYVPEFPYSDIFLTPSKYPQWVWSWANFDGVHYITIAKAGYIASFTQAFFPLYPFLIGKISTIFSDTFVFFTAQAISFICFMVAIYFLTKLLLLDYKKETTLKIIIAVLVFPTSFFFAAVYTESLFFLLTVLSFYCLRRKKWFLTSIIVFLASATKVLGILLLIPAVHEYIVANISWVTMKHDNKITKLFKIIILNFKNPVLYIGPLGILIYMYYLWVSSGDPLTFYHAQSSFGVARQTEYFLPLQIFYRYARIVLTLPFGDKRSAIAFIEMLTFIFAIISVFFGYLKRIHFSYMVFSIAIIIIPTITGTLTSMPRYILPCLTIYIWLANRSNKYAYISLMIISFMMLLITTVWFLSGHFIA